MPTYQIFKMTELLFFSEPSFVRKLIIPFILQYLTKSNNLNTGLVHA